VPERHDLYVMIYDLALHAWDVCAWLDPVARLSMESVAALMQQIPQLSGRLTLEPTIASSRLIAEGEHEQGYS
jgi:hypothetical protein